MSFATGNGMDLSRDRPLEAGEDLNKLDLSMALKPSQANDLACANGKIDRSGVGRQSNPDSHQRFFFVRLLCRAPQADARAAKARRIASYRASSPTASPP